MSKTYPAVFHTYMYKGIYYRGTYISQTTIFCSFEIADRFRFHQKFETAQLPVEERFSNFIQQPANKTFWSVMGLLQTQRLPEMLRTKARKNRKTES